MALNNNDDPNLERRLIVAIVLSVLLVLILLPFMNKSSKMPALATAEKKAPVTAPAPAPTVPPGQTKTLVPSAPQAAKRTPATPAKAAPAPPKLAPIAAAAAKTFTVTTPVYQVVFSNQGAVAQSWTLTQYEDNNGKPLDVIGPSFSKEFGYPLAFWVKDAAVRKQLADALYTVQQTRAADGSQTVTFSWSDGSLLAKKTITFNQTYVAQVQASLTRDGQPVGAALAWQGAFGDRAVPGDFGTEKLFQQSGSSVETFEAKKVNTGASHQGVYQFAGVEDKYFALAFLPAGTPSLTLTTFKNQYQPRLVDASGNITTNKPVDTIGLAIATGNGIQTRLFVGPKKLDLLTKIDPALRGLVDFGWFSFLAEPLFLWMNWTYAHWIHNYGWAILFMTFIITMATFPLKMKAQKSQAKMMALQPKINALNAKMKRYPMRDPRRQEVQKEVMGVYQEHGVNPLGGCLPMLIQLPLIYAFWEMLEVAIELRHAPFIGYIHDLSGKDPYFLLPILVVISQFGMSALMPTTPGQDPRQAKLMKWAMPIFIGWFFFYLPSGVNLYYLGYNVVSTGQQWVANKTYNDAAVAAVAAKDRAKERDKPALPDGEPGGGKPRPGGGGGKKKLMQGKAVSPKR